MDWTGYPPFNPSIDRPLRDVPRAEAERHFALVMAERPARQAALATLLRQNDLDIAKPDTSAPGDHLAPVQRLNDWLVAALRADVARGLDPLRGPEAAAWSSLIVDLALHLGDAIMARAPHITWQLFTRLEKATGYHRPVLAGFRRVSDASYYVDVAHLVSTYAGLVCKGHQVKPDYLRTLVRIALEQA